MATAEQCINRIAAAMGDASLDDQVRMATEADRIVRENAGLTADEIFKKVDEAIQDNALAKKIEARNKALNSFAVRTGTQFIDAFDDKALGVEALLVGINDLRMGSRRSVAAQQSALQESYMGGIVADLEQLGDDVYDVFATGVLDDDIARALWQFGKDDANLSGINKTAVKAAEVIHKWQEVTRVDANKAGAWIKKMPGYITRQSHDMDKIRKAGEKEWIDAILPALDERTFDGVEDREAFLASAFRGLSTGVHLGNGTVPGLKGFRNVGKSMSQERVLHFKDADSWIRYNQRFGVGSMRDAVIGSLMTSAQNTGLMRGLGPNAEMNYNAIIDRLENELASGADKDASVKFTAAKNGRLDNYIKMLTGSTNIPASNLGASIGQGVRALNSLRMLGGAVISSITDITNSAAELRYQGQGFLSAYGSALAHAGGAIGDIGRSIANRKLTVKNKGTRRAMAELGISLDATTGRFTSRFDMAGDTLPGRSSRAMQTFFRLNGLTLWTDSIRTGATIGMARHVGDLAGMKHADLPEGLADTFSLYGIGAAEWDLIRSAGLRNYEGVEGGFLVPEAMRDIPEDRLALHLESIGVKPSKFQINKLRDDLESSLRMYYVDRSQYAVIEPDAKTRATLLRDTQPGTVAGEFMRAIVQFKSFPFAIVQKVWGRELRGRRSKSGSIGSMAEYMAMSMLFGYIAMSAKDMTKNRTPRDPSDPKALGAAFLQGGGAGIYGDFLFGDIKNRFGGSALDTIAGPTAGTFSEVMNILGKAREGDADAGKDLFRLAYQSAPGLAGLAVPHATMLNAAYVKAVTDNLIYYNIMEALSPGYKARMERRLKKENDQELLIK